MDHVLVFWTMVKIFLKIVAYLCTLLYMTCVKSASLQFLHVPIISSLERELSSDVPQIDSVTQCHVT